MSRSCATVVVEACFDFRFEEPAHLDRPPRACSDARHESMSRVRDHVVRPSTITAIARAVLAGQETVHGFGHRLLGMADRIDQCSRTRREVARDEQLAMSVRSRRCIISHWSSPTRRSPHGGVDPTGLRELAGAQQTRCRPCALRIRCRRWPPVDAGRSRPASPSPLRTKRYRPHVAVFTDIGNRATMNSMGIDLRWRAPRTSPGVTSISFSERR